MELSVTLSWLSRVEHQSAFNLMGKGKSIRSRSNGLSKVLEAEKKIGGQEGSKKTIMARSISWVMTHIQGSGE